MKSTTLGSYLKQIREENNIPQRIVAHRLNIDTSTLSKIELGERQLTINMIVGLAEVKEVFSSPKFGDIAGCIVSEGLVKRANPIRVLRAFQSKINGVLHDLYNAPHLFKNLFSRNISAHAFVVYGEFPEGVVFVGVERQHFFAGNEGYL